MQKHIIKIENVNYSSDIIYHDNMAYKENNIYKVIENLTIENLGNFNLFSGKIENGYYGLKEILVRKCSGGKALVRNNFMQEVHYSELKKEIDFVINNYKKNGWQMFWFTQRYDVIQAFAEVAQEFKDVEAYYYRLGRSAIPSDNNRSVVSMYTVDELIEATSKNREVR